MKSKGTFKCTLCTMIQQIRDECAIQGVKLFNTHPERPEKLYFNGEGFNVPQMIFVDEENQKILCPMWRDMPWSAKSVAEVVKYCAGGKMKNPCNQCSIGLK